jgi:hypothetical protein
MKKQWSNSEISILKKCLEKRMGVAEIAKLLERSYESVDSKVFKLKSVGEVKDDKEPKVLYFDIETAPMEVACFRTGKQNISWKSVIQDSFVLCWAAQWIHVPNSKIISACVTLKEARKRSDKNCLYTLRDLMDEADYLVGHNMRGFDWKTVNDHFLLHGWDAPHDAKIFDTLTFSRRIFRPRSHALDSWMDELGEERKEDMRLEDWIKCLKGDDNTLQAALRKMHTYCRGDIRRGVRLTKIFQRYFEQATGKKLFK